MLRAFVAQNKALLEGALTVDSLLSFKHHIFFYAGVRRVVDQLWCLSMIS